MKNKCLFCERDHDDHAENCEQIREVALLLGGGTLEGVLALLRASPAKTKRRKGGVRFAHRAKSLRRQGMTWREVRETLGNEGYVSNRGRAPSIGAIHAAVHGKPKPTQEGVE